MSFWFLASGFWTRHRVLSRLRCLCSAGVAQSLRASDRLGQEQSLGWRLLVVKDAGRQVCID